MTSRYAPAYRCLNGPHGGQYIQAPFEMRAGQGCALGWDTAKGTLNYAVYLLVDRETLAEMGADGALEGPALGLLFLRSWPTPQAAQTHVQQLGMVIGAAEAVHRAANGHGDAPAETPP